MIKYENIKRIYDKIQNLTVEIVKEQTNETAQEVSLVELAMAFSFYSKLLLRFVDMDPSMPEGSSKAIEENVEKAITDKDMENAINVLMEKKNGKE